GLTRALNHPVPQISRTAQTMIHGRSAAHTCALLSSEAVPVICTGGIVDAESSWLRNAGDSQSSFGRQIFSNPIRQAMDIRDAPMSTIQGLMKFEIRNCGTAKETPHTRIAGQICTMPRQPANAQINQNGTISEKNGSWRPTMAPST